MAGLIPAMYPLLLIFAGGVVAFGVATAMVGVALDVLGFVGRVAGRLEGRR